MPDRRCIVVALAGMDGTVAQHLMDDGRLPNLLKLVERGASAETLWPEGSTAIAQWLTITTGGLPRDHGIPATPVLRADGFGVTLAERSGLRMPHIWERMAHAARPVGVVNWPATHDTGSVAGQAGLTVAADSFFYMEGRDGARWPAFPESVFPRSETRALLPHRVHADDLRRPDRPSRLGRHDGALLRLHGRRGWLQLGRAESVVAVASALAAKDGSLFVFLDLLEMLGLPGSQVEAEVVLYAYQLLDAALGRLAGLMGDEADIVVITRPPDAALRAQGGKRPSGLAVFATRMHQADSLLPGMAPEALARHLAEICQAGPGPKPQPREDLSAQLSSSLQARHAPKCRPLRFEREAADAVRERDKRMEDL